MQNYKTTVVFLLLFSCLLQAHEADPFINARKAGVYNYNNPLDQKEAVAFIEPYDPTFYIYPQTCDSVRDFKITNLAMRLEYLFVSKKDLDNWLYQYDCQFHVVRVDYEVTCRNKLRYSGTEHLFSPSKIENNTGEWPSNERGDRMADEAYGWIENLDPNEYIGANGYITKDPVRYWPHYSPIAILDTNAIKNKWTRQKVSIPKQGLGG